jgi:hypothetical protein
MALYQQVHTHAHPGLLSAPLDTGWVRVRVRVKPRVRVRVRF